MMVDSPVCSAFFKRDQKSGFACEIFQFRDKHMQAAQTTPVGPWQLRSHWAPESEPRG